MNTLTVHLADEQATVNFGKALSEQVKRLGRQGIVVFLHGDLGAGKTTFTRGFVQGMGHDGKVKSPTYTLVEPYKLEDWSVYHFDLYRLADPEELEYMGIRDYFGEQCCCFVEWPERGQGVLPDADMTITLRYDGESRNINLVANNEYAEQLIAALAE